jgi:PAS domain S-box-containing protein
MKFEYIIYIGMTFIPVISLFIALVFINPKVNLRRCWWFYVIPVITNILLWTNKYHNLIFVKYSTDLVQTKYGNWFNFVYAPTYYIYLCITIFILIRGSIKKSGFFSIQTGLIVLGAMIPIVINFVGLLKIIPMTIYITPISMIFTVICFSLAIFKYKALNITPIAFRTVINTMSDAFIVISDDGTIVDKNLTFENTFGGILKANTDDNLFEMIEKSNLLDLKNLKIHIGETRKEKKIINEEYHIVNGNFNRYFQVDIHPIKAKQITQYIGTLLLFKDITEHKNDIKVIEDKQEVIVKQGQLVSIGELAGGVAHDINTPISAIKTGIQLLQEMYVPRDDTEKELLIRMSNCTEKIIKIVNSMRNQIRNLGSDQKSNFKISEVIEDVRIIAYNEFQKNKCELIINIEDDLSVYGDPTKLGQVFTNLFLNAIQAYNEQPGKIEVSVSKAPNNKVMVKVRDYAGGIPEKIKEFVFKNILTTKGTKGTGLGLYLAYSVIKGEFSGDITFESSEGQGTTFYIILDRAKEEIKNVVQKV